MEQISLIIIGTIANLTYQNYEEIAKKIRPIVSEAQIVMRRAM